MAVFFSKSENAETIVFTPNHRRIIGLLILISLYVIGFLSLLFGNVLVAAIFFILALAFPPIIMRVDDMLVLSREPTPLSVARGGLARTRVIAALFDGKPIHVKLQDEKVE
jgi:hypothetical protein